KNNKDSLRKINCTLINGVLGVMIRTLKNHSCTLKETMVYLFFKLLSILYNYVVEKSSPEEEINENDYKVYLEVHIDFIINFYLEDDLDFEKYNSELWEIGKQYRELYFLFNPPRLVAKTSVIERVPALVRIPVEPVPKKPNSEEEELKEN
ncbi:MAG: hypothetical protein ACFFG0_37660, partial [Candidatus Thorarchaeota archaeon]